MFQAIITAMEVAALHEHFCPPPPVLMRFAAVYKSLFLQLLIFRWKNLQSEVHQKLYLKTRTNIRGCNHALVI